MSAARSAVIGVLAFVAGGVVTYVAKGASGGAAAAAPGVTAPADTAPVVQQASGREPQFENGDLKTWKSTIVPGTPLALHRHDHGRALVALTDGVLNVVDSTGKVLDTYNLTAGKAMWLGKDPPGQMHADVNPGTKPVQVIVVQLQKD